MCSSDLGKLAHEVLLNAASVVLIGGFFIGLITGHQGGAKLATFTGPVFQGVLCVFLLGLGVRAGQQLAAARGFKLGLLAMGIVLPILGPPVLPLKTGARYLCGVVRERERTVVVAAGTGTSVLPFRLGAPPDLWVVEVGPRP